MASSDEIIKVLEYLSDKLGVTIDWTQDNFIPYIKELGEKLVNWEINTSVMYIIVFSVLMLGTIIACKLLSKHDMIDAGTVILAGFVLLGWFIGIVIQVYDIIECNTIPEKFIYDYVKYYISNNR